MEEYELTCSVCKKHFLFDGPMSSDEPMCDKCAEEEWQELIKKKGLAQLVVECGYKKQARQNEHNGKADKENK